MELLDYLQSLPAATVDRLYRNGWACVAIFRTVSPVAQQIVLRLLQVQEWPLTALKLWAASDSGTVFQSALDRLIHIRVVMKRTGTPSAVLSLNTAFREHLQQFLFSPAPLAGPTLNAPTAEQLTQFADEKWNSILYFMAGLESAVVPTDEVVQVLVDTGLMNASKEGFVISHEGFRFLLGDTHSQVWTFAMQYVQRADKRGLDVVEALAFVLQLSLLEVGRGYALAGLSEGQRALLGDLFDFGLVFVSQVMQAFYPTRLAAALGSGGRPSAADGFILVETNFRVYAYVRNELHVTLLAFFAEVLYRLPNLCVAALTRDSVTQAYTKGITADTILEFIEYHAHPEMLAQIGPRGPPEVGEQLRLWEAERRRVAYTPAVLFDAFATSGLFGRVWQYAQDCGVCVYGDAASRVLVVQEAGADLVRQFLQRFAKEG